MRNAIRPVKALTLSVAACLIFIAGCDMIGDLEENPKSFASPSNFYTTPAQIEGVFASTQANLWGFWVVGYDWSMINTFQHTDQFDGGNLVIQANHGSHLWAKHYANVAELNFAIASLQQGKVSAAQGTIDELMGQAKFLRAWNYFMLVRMWGDLPLLTEEQTDDYFNYKPSRTPVAGVYDLIVGDLKEAVDKLPPTWPSGNTARPTMDAAKAILAEVYLTMATHPVNDPQYYDDAADYARQVIEDGRYSLVEDVSKVFSFETEDGPEMIWSFKSNYERQTISPQVWSEMKGWGDQTAEEWWVDQYPEQPRKGAYLELENAEGLNWKEVGASPGIKKYLYDTEADYNAGRSVIDMPIIRYAEVLLIFAEAENMSKGGPTPEAVAAINQVIDRANGYQANPAHPRLTMGMSQAEFDEAVIEERNWELCFEYDRWFDLIRKRMLLEKSRPEIQQNFSEADYLFPIPMADMRLNENLVQNPGY